MVKKTSISVKNIKLLKILGWILLFLLCILTVVGSIIWELGLHYPAGEERTKYLEERAIERKKAAEARKEREEKEDECIRILKRSPIYGRKVNCLFQN